MTDRPAVGGLDARAAVLMVVLTASWGVGQAAMKVGASGFSPVLQTVLRSAIAAILVYGWCLYRGIRLWERDGTLLPGLLVGLLFGTEFLLLFSGLDLTSAARSVLILYSMPFWVMLGAHFLLNERMSLRKSAAMALSFLGLAIAFGDGASRPGPDAWKGDLMILVAAILWAAATLLVRTSRLATAGPEKVLLYQLVISAAMSAVLLAGGGPHLRDPSALPVVALAFQAVWVVAVTYLVWFWLITRYQAAALSAFTFLTPVFGVLASAFVLGEPSSGRVWLALAMIAVALVWANLPARKVPTAEVPT